MFIYYMTLRPTHSSLHFFTMRSLFFLSCWFIFFMGCEAAIDLQAGLHFGPVIQRMTIDTAVVASDLIVMRGGTGSNSLLSMGDNGLGAQLLTIGYLSPTPLPLPVGGRNVAVIGESTSGGSPGAAVMFGGSGLSGATAGGLAGVVGGFAFGSGTGGFAVLQGGAIIDPSQPGPGGEVRVLTMGLTGQPPACIPGTSVQTSSGDMRIETMNVPYYPAPLGPCLQRSAGHSGTLYIQTGVSDTGAVGLLSLRGGFSLGNNGGDLFVAAGDSLADTPHRGGQVTVETGKGSFAGAGGDLWLQASNGGAGAGAGGRVRIVSGVSNDDTVPRIAAELTLSVGGHVGTPYDRFVADNTRTYLTGGASNSLVLGSATDVVTCGLPLDRPTCLPIFCVDIVGCGTGALIIGTNAVSPTTTSSIDLNAGTIGNTELTVTQDALFLRTDTVSYVTPSGAANPWTFRRAIAADTGGVVWNANAGPFQVLSGNPTTEAKLIVDGASHTATLQGTTTTNGRVILGQAGQPNELTIHGNIITLVSGTASGVQI